MMFTTNDPAVLAALNTLFGNSPCGNDPCTCDSSTETKINGEPAEDFKDLQEFESSLHITFGKLVQYLNEVSPATAITNSDKILAYAKALHILTAVEQTL